MKNFKEKLDSSQFEEDHLPVFQDIPAAQKWQVVNYIENQKSAVQAYEELTLFEFLRKVDDKILKKTIKGEGNFNLFSEKYSEFKDINKEYLDKKFEETFGSDYDRCRIWCSFGSYPTKTAADKVAEELSKTRGRLHGSFVIIENGYYVPFNPTPEMCSDFKSTNKIMNDFMKGQTENKIIKNALFNKRKQTLIEKNIRDGQSRGEKVALKGGNHETPTESEFQKDFDRFDPSDTIDLSIKREDGARRQAREQMDLELKIGQYEIISLEGLQHLGYPAETIEFVRKEQEKIRERKEKEEIRRKLEEEKKKFEKVEEDAPV